MTKLIVAGIRDEDVILDVKPDATVMETIRDAGADGLLALCGGCCSCGTCHVYVDDAWLGRLAPMSPDENDLLETSSLRKPNSRLSCQLRLQAELEGLRVTIAPQS